MRAHCISESPSPSRLFSTTAQNVPTGRAAPVTHDHLPRCSILFKVSPITSSGDAVGRPGDYRMPIRSSSITICRMIGRPFSTTRGACSTARRLFCFSASNVACGLLSCTSSIVGSRLCSTTGRVGRTQKEVTLHEEGRLKHMQFRLSQRSLQTHV